MTAVGQPLDDDSREDAIRRAGELMERRYAVWGATGDFAALGDAHNAMLLMKALVSGRSLDTIARLEAERGLL